MFNTKLLLSVALFFMLTLSAFAQNSNWTLGLEQGPAISSLRGNDVLNELHKSRFAATASISLQYNLSDKFSLKTALLYEQKGSKTEITFFDDMGNTTGVANHFFDYQYLTVPLLCRATFGKSLKYFVNAGPYLSVLLDAREKNPKQVKNTTTSYKNYDAGLAAGVGISYPLKQNLTISAELRNQLGLMNVSNITLLNNGSIMHNSAQFLLGVQYRL